MTPPGDSRDPTVSEPKSSQTTGEDRHRPDSQEIRLLVQQLVGLMQHIGSGETPAFQSKLDRHLRWSRPWNHLD